MSVAAAPAVSDVWAFRLLTHGGKLELTQLGLDAGVLVTTGELGPLHPIRL